jgi:hypothetical protein
MDRQLSPSPRKLARLRRDSTELHGSSAATKPTRIALGDYLRLRECSRLLAERRDEFDAAQQPRVWRRRRLCEHGAGRQRGGMQHARSKRLLLR